MRTLNLKEAANFLNIHWQTLRQRVISGEIPGAKIGKSYIFLEDDLVEYIRSLYPDGGRASSKTGELRCSTNVKTRNITGADSSHLTERRYAELLKPPTNMRPKNLKYA
jgi:excisionase family DNA binding protein